MPGESRGRGIPWGAAVSGVAQSVMCHGSVEVAKRLRKGLVFLFKTLYISLDFILVNEGIGPHDSQFPISTLKVLSFIFSGDDIHRGIVS